MLINWLDKRGKSWIEVIKTSSVMAVLTNGVHYDGKAVLDRYKVIQRNGKTWDCIGFFDGTQSEFLHYNKVRINSIINRRWN